VLAELGGSRIITRADGVYIHDGEGHQILDGMAGLWCVNVGYGREELAKAAYDQMLELPYYNTFFKTATPPPVKLAAKIAEKMGGHLTHVFYNSSGSEANDTVFRLARHYWKLKGQPQPHRLHQPLERLSRLDRGRRLAGRHEAHACTGRPADPRRAPRDAALSVRRGLRRGSRRLPRPGRAGDRGQDPGGRSRERRRLHRRAGAGGGRGDHPAGRLLAAVEALCRKYGILLVCDEVICGFGRLGQWFGHQHYGIKPDMIAMAKGLSSGYLPISAVGVADHIVAELREKGGDFIHGFTYSGHPTAAAVALKNLEIIEREGLVERTRDDTGPYLAKALATLNDHPLVGETRSLGLIGAVEIVREKGTNHRFLDKEGEAGPIVRDLCIANGLMVRAIRDSIVCCPPLIITHGEIDDLVGIIRKSLDEAEPVLRALKPEGVS
jgi:putrescine aminotransferase